MCWWKQFCVLLPQSASPEPASASTVVCTHYASSSSASTVHARCPSDPYQQAPSTTQPLLNFPPPPQVWLSYAKFEATPLAVLATPADEDEERTEEERQQQLAEAEAAEGGEAGTGGGVRHPALG